MSPALPAVLRGFFRSVTVFCACRRKRVAGSGRRAAAFAPVAGALCAACLLGTTLAACSRDDRAPGVQDNADGSAGAPSAARGSPPGAQSFNAPLASSFSGNPNATQNAVAAPLVPPSSIVVTPAPSPADTDAAASAPLASPVIHTVD